MPGKSKKPQHHEFWIKGYEVMQLARKILVASMGFTVDFIIRRVNDLGRENVSHIILVGLKVPGEQSSWERVEQSYGLLKTFLKPLSITTELKEVIYRDDLERQLKDILAEAFARYENSTEHETTQHGGHDPLECGVELYLAGGPRILVVSLLLAGFIESIINPHRNLCVVSYGEGFDAKYERNLRLLVNYMKLDDIHKSILDALSKGIVKAEKIRGNTKVKRSTFYKKLEELREMGMIVQDRRGYWKLSPDVEKLL